PYVDLLLILILERETRVAVVGIYVLARPLLPGDEARAAVVEHLRVLELLGGEERVAVIAQPEVLDHSHLVAVIEAVVRDGSGLEVRSLHQQRGAFPLACRKSELGMREVRWRVRPPIHEDDADEIEVLELEDDELGALEDLHRERPLHRIDDGGRLAGILE